MSVLLLLIGIVIGCLNVVAYSYLFLVSITNFEDIRESLKNHTYRLPILGINNDLATFSIVCFVMSLISVLMVYGLAKKRTSFMWPWILAAFHVLGNYGYLMLRYLIQEITTGPTVDLASESLIPGLFFVGQVALYFMIFIIFKRIFIENLTRRFELARW